MTTLDTVRDEYGRFGLRYEEPLAKQVIGVRLPESVHQVVHPLENRTEFIRAAIVEKLKRDGLLPATE